ncbi:MAG TPA: class I SAM-dependent methyltransferase [Jatrophihabitantaceae bacterium]
MAESPLGWNEVFSPAASGFDSLVPFLATAQLLAADASVVVEVGCGRGAMVAAGNPRPFQDLRGPGRQVIGIDIDPAGKQNPALDEFRLIEGDRWPLSDGEADLAVSDWTLEHVENPTAFVAELTRVLRPGGAFVARTVSRHSLLSLASRSVPNAKHARVLEKIQPGREARDVFPTMYRMNTRRDLAALLDREFEWTVAHRGGLHHYAHPWPRLARAIAVVEPRLPQTLRTTLVIYARKRT